MVFCFFLLIIFSTYSVLIFIPSIFFMRLFFCLHQFVSLTVLVIDSKTIFLVKLWSSSVIKFNAKWMIILISDISLVLWVLRSEEIISLNESLNESLNFLLSCFWFGLNRYWLILRLDQNFLPIFSNFCGVTAWVLVFLVRSSNGCITSIFICL